mmetsp:Transcript_15016/g.28260  ORF Transcript_15016/g.28260 Transcript_15016/m.28260 type:complete len:1413 (+) Transcript_15016:145-4383(+)
MSDLQSSDDEFDELFSFSGVTTDNNKNTTTNNTSTGVAAKSSSLSSSSSFHLDLSQKEPAVALDNPSAIPPATAASTTAANDGRASTQTSESGSSSYYHVSNDVNVINDHDDNHDLDDFNLDDDDDDDDDAETNLNLNLNANKQQQNANVEDDFHDLDADTRELLEFLDEPSKKVTDIKSSSALDTLEHDLEDSEEEEEDEDGDTMDFVDIEGNSKEQGKPVGRDLEDKNTSTVAASSVVTASNVIKTKTESKMTVSALEQEEVAVKEKEHDNKTEMEKNNNEKETTTPSKITMATTAALDQQKSPVNPFLSSPPNHLSKRETSTASSNPYQLNSILSSMDDDSIESDFKSNNHNNNNAQLMTTTTTTNNNNETTNYQTPNKNNDPSGNTLHKVEIQQQKEPIIFESLAEAVRSRDSPIKTIQSMLFPHTMELARVDDADRAHLWSKMICSRTLSDVEMSSLADSFVHWDELFDMKAFQEGEKCYGFMQDFVNHLLEEVDLLSKRIVVGSSDGDDDDELLTTVKRNLCSILVFYYQSNFIPNQQTKSTVAESQEIAGLDDSLVMEEDVTENVRMEFDTESKDHHATDDDVAVVSEEKQLQQPKEEKRHVVEWNSLIGPIACILIASGATNTAASVMLSRIIPTYMPLVPLTKDERVEALKSLHVKLHHLVCYHLPLLSLHLDRNIPGWYWPQSVVDNKDELSDFENNDNVTEKSRHLEEQGIIPITWFSSLLAGEGHNLTLEKSRMLALWDVLLSARDQSLKFFLALSVLEKNSEKLLMLKGSQLIDELTAVLSLKNDEEVESFQAAPTDGKTQLDHGQEYVRMWIQHARTLRQNTPVTVVEYLNKSEDDAVHYILNQRSKIAMETVAARLEAEAEAHRRAMEEENAKKVEERLRKYYRDRLLKFYEKHCPEKIGSIDQILDIYHDRYQVLDKKLHAKYGKGFLPLISVFNPKVTSQTGKMISTVNQGIEIKKKNIIAARAEERAKLFAEQMEGTKQKNQVAIPVSASEIIPIVCGGKKIEKVTRMTRETLKYYLVDSRPEASMKAQGAFPTASRLSPEDLMDPERLQQKIEMFEALRGTVHIVIMGEGFSAFPSLYGHPLDINEQKLLENDESRTSMCALFFIKRGFPFVSILDGGFAAAHAWLARELKNELSLSEVLIDYDLESSLFADLERSYQEQEEFKSAPARRKTMLAMQKLIDNSMIRLTAAEAQIEEFTDRFMTARKEVKDKETTESSEDDNKKSEDPALESTTEDVENESKLESSSLKNTVAGFRSKVSNKNNNGVTKDQMMFDLSKISFGRERNSGKDSVGSDSKKSQLSFFKKQSNNEDYELEKKIDESLAPPENQLEEGKQKSNIFQRMKLVNTNNSDKKNIKDAFAKIKFTKFNSARPTIPVEEDDTDALCQEESVLFD